MTFRFDESVSPQEMSSKPTKILVVHQDERVLTSLQLPLQGEGYNVFLTYTGTVALKIAKEELPDIILVGQKIEDIETNDLINLFKQDRKTHNIPIILLLSSIEEWRTKRDLRISDWVVFDEENRYSDTELVLTRIHLQLKLNFLLREFAKAEHVLFHLARLIERKNHYPETHAHRVAELAEKIGRNMSLSSEDLRYIRKGALLRDIGNIGISEAVLNKPGRLTLEEFELIKQHPILGEELCTPITSLEGVLPIIRFHHERWDGSGYPDGLISQEIPLLSRITSVADTYEAFISERPYRNAYTPKEALSIMVGGAGSYWDPGVIKELIVIVS